MSIFERLKSGVRCASHADTLKLGRAIAQALPDEAVVTLEGDLGAGKTTLVKGFALAWGIEDPVTSPSFNILHLYKGSGERLLAHMDAYRLDPADDPLDSLMLDDFLRPPYCLAIEWPERLGELPAQPTLRLSIAIEPDQARHVRAAPPVSGR